MSVNSYSELIERTPDIWRVFTTEFITLRVPNNSDSNHRRWAISQFWETVQSAGGRFGECQGVQRWKQKEAHIEPMMAQIKGLMASVVALDSTVRGEYFAISRLESEIKNYLSSEELHIKVLERRGRYSNI